MYGSDGRGCNIITNFDSIEAQAHLNSGLHSEYILKLSQADDPELVAWAISAL